MKTNTRNAILIANIGNRNITFQEEFIPTNQFYETTKLIWERFEEKKKLLDIRILNTMIEKVKDRLSHVIIFSSEQLNVDRNNQDTFYEGEILCRLFKEQYPEIDFQNIKLTAPVTDNNLLIQTYRWKIKGLLKKFVDQKFILCDAGGTAQQKSSLKIILEFLLPNDQLEVFNVLRVDKNQSKIVENTPIEYRKIINEEQIKSLIQLLEYEAALHLKGHTNVKKALDAKNISDKLLAFASLRKQRLHKEAQNSLSNFKQKSLQKYSFLTDYKTGTPQIGNLALKQLFREEHLFKLGEDFALAEFYHQKKQYNKAIINCSIFYEKYLNLLITAQFNYNLLGNYNAEKERMIKEVKKLYPDIKTAFGNFPLQDNLRFKLLLAAKCNTPQHIKIIQHLNLVLRHGADNPALITLKYPNALPLNTARNDMAHKGIYFDEAFIKTNLPYLKDWLQTLKKLLQMPDTNIYQKINNAIASSF